MSERLKAAFALATVAGTISLLSFSMCLLFVGGEPEIEPAEPPVHPPEPVEHLGPPAGRTEVVAAHTGPLHQADKNPVQDLILLDRLLRHYAMAQANQLPAGTNAEVTAALTRPDLYGIAALPADHPAISPSGELSDRWGRPYFFHSLSSTRMEIRSAGPDGRMYTADDLLWPDPASAGPLSRNAALRIH